jgi:hypothetical protein
MLDIIFYPENDLPPAYVDLSDTFYEWLARSDFSRIGQSQSTPIELEGESLELPLISLEQSTRKQLAEFLRNQIVDETDRVLDQLGESISKQNYQDVTYGLRKLQELRKCVENQTYSYLQRV